MHDHSRIIDAWFTEPPVTSKNFVLTNVRGTRRWRPISFRKLQFAAPAVARFFGFDPDATARGILAAYDACAVYNQDSKSEWEQRGPFEWFLLTRCTFSTDGGLQSVSFENYPGRDRDWFELETKRGDAYEGMRKLYPSLADIPLENLNLDNNVEMDLSTLSNLPKSLRVLRLSRLDLGGNRELPQGFQDHFANLHSVNLDGNPNGWREALLRLPPTVTSLSLSRCNLQRLPEDIGRILPALEILDLSENPIDSSAALPHIPSLKQLIMLQTDWNMPLEALPAGLADAFPILETLRVSSEHRSFTSAQAARLPHTVTELHISMQKEMFPATYEDGSAFRIRSLHLPRITVQQLMSLPSSLETLSIQNIDRPSAFVETLTRSISDQTEIPEGFSDRFPNLTSFTDLPSDPFDKKTILRLPPSLRKLVLHAHSEGEIPDVFSGHLSGIRELDFNESDFDSSMFMLLPRQLRVLKCQASSFSSSKSSRHVLCFSDGFKDRCPFLEVLKAGGYDSIDLLSLRNVASTLRCLDLSGYRRNARKETLPDDLLSWFPNLQEIFLEKSGYVPPDSVADQVHFGGLRVFQ